MIKLLVRFIHIEFRKNIILAIFYVYGDRFIKDIVISQIILF